MDVIPKFVAGIFLFRTLKNPINRIAEIIKESQSPLLVLSFFLLGELGLSGIFKLLPLFIYLHLQYHSLPNVKKWSLSDLKEYFNQLNDMDQFTLILTPVISSTAFLTGWFVRDPHVLRSLPINTFFFHLTSYLLWFILMCGSIAYSLKFTHKVLLISQLLYLTLFLSGEHLSFLFLFIFVIIGLLTKRDQADTPFLSFYMIESCLTVGTLFTSAPANILFAIVSLALVWKLSKLNDQLKKISPPHDPILCNYMVQLPTVETTIPTKPAISEIISGIY